MKTKLLFILLSFIVTHITISQETESQVKDLLSKGKRHLEQFRLDSAKSTFDRASRASENSDLWDLYFDAQLNQAMVAFLSRKQAESDQIIDALYDRVAENSSLVNDSSVALLNYINANLLWRQSKYLESRRRISEALRLAEISKISDSNKAKMLLIEGNINLHLSNYGQAIKGFLNCLELQPDKSNRLSMFVYNNVGQAYAESRNSQLGMEYYLRGLAVCNKLYDPDHPYFTYFYQNIGNLYWQMNDDENAGLYYKKLIDLAERVLDPKNPDLAKHYNNVAGFLAKKGMYDSARSYLNKSFEILGDGYTRNKRLAYNTLARIQGDEMKYEEALESHDKALEIEKQIKGSDSHFLAQTLIEKSEIYRDMKQYEEAIALHNQILSSISSDWVAGEWYENPSLDMLIAGYEDEAIEALLKKAVVMNEMHESYERVNASFVFIEHLLDKLEADYLSPQEQYNLVEYESELALLKVHSLSVEFENTNDENLLEEMFQSMERSKARILKLELESRHSNNLYRLDDDLFEKNKELLLSIAHYQSIIVSSKSQSEIDSLNTLIFNLNRAKDSVEAIVRERYPVAYKKQYGKATTSIQEVQDRLGDSEALVQYFVGDVAIHMIFINREKASFLKQPIPKNLENLIRTASIQSSDQLDADAFFELHHLLLQPLELSDEISSLTIIPDKLLWNVNFELLLNEKPQAETPIKDWPFLIKQRAVHYEYAASTFTDIAINAQTNGKVLAMSFGDKDTGESGLIRSFKNLSELPGSREEIRRISKHLDGDYYFGNNASESNFKQEAPKYSILHLALHGETREDNPNNSRLVFYSEADENEDGFLHAFELYGLELGAELAVLSACKTGEGPLINGEGIMSLGRAFSSSGVRSLVISRWVVPDATAPVIMDSFYQELMNGKNKSEALRTAKLAYLKRADNLTAHPYYWSSFYILGSDSSMDLSSDLSLYLLVPAVVIVVFIAIQIKRRMAKQN